MDIVIIFVALFLLGLCIGFAFIGWLFYEGLCILLSRRAKAEECDIGEWD